MTTKLKISIDGPAAAGKTTLGRKLARLSGSCFMDTGLTFRAVALASYWMGRRPTLNETARIVSDLAHRPYQPRKELEEAVVYRNENITSQIWGEECNGVLPWVSDDVDVRTMLHVYHAYIIGRHDRIIVAGRDVAVTLLWDAEVSVYLDADFDVRRSRRRAQLLAGDRGTPVLGPKGPRDVHTRTFVSRATSGIVIDSTVLAPDEVVERVTEVAGLDGG